MVLDVLLQQVAGLQVGSQLCMSGRQFEGVRVLNAIAAAMRATAMAPMANPAVAVSFYFAGKGAACTLDVTTR